MILAKTGSYKISHVKGEKNGTPYEFYSLERSYKDKQDQWKRENIVIRPQEMSMVENLLRIAYCKIVEAQTDAANNRAQNAGDAYQSDDVPF